MYCNKCWNVDTKVMDTRVSQDWKTIRRRRECWNCHNRFTTFERIEIADLIVIKSWNKREFYNREKIEESILKACNKRKVSIQKIHNIIADIELSLGWNKEVMSKDIWVLVLEGLKKLDEVAYIRYASVNLRFNSAKDFLDFIQKEFFL